MRAKEFITEAFDQPYPIQWEEGEDGGTADALAKLGDGTYLSIMFTDDYYGDELGDWGIEFHRNNSQEVTGEGDAQKVFATVLEAIRQFVDSHNPNSVTFSASKEPEADMAQPGSNVNPESRAKLYNRLVQRYAGSMGYSAQQEEGKGKITYVLRRATYDMTESESNDTAISLSKLGKFHPGTDTLAEFVPERATAQYALHPDKWESTFYSLTNKDSDKLKYYGPKKISIPPGTLVGDMAIANKFYRAKTPEEQEHYAELYKASLQPYPVDVSQYRMPELLIPRQGVAEGKITLSTDPNWYGATVDNYQASGPVVNIPANQLVGFEPDDKMNQPKSKANVEKIVAGLKQGAKLPPLLIRKYKNGYQVLDGHHRFWAYKLLGVKSIPAQIVPDSDIKEISKQGVAEARGLAPTKPYDDLMANMGYFMSLNTVKIQQDAVDSNAQQELANMQQQFRKPILNGMSFFDVNRDMKISKNPKVAPILLKYVYDMLGYIEPRIKKYIKPEQQGKYLDRLDQIKNDYRGAVAQVS
jgi:hypothetical protein